VPPTEWDPNTGEALDPTDLVDVGPGGVVESWAWVTEPTGKHPLKRRSRSLVKLDGCDTAMCTRSTRLDRRDVDRHAGRRTGRTTASAHHRFVFVPEAAQ
jgi:hypothetical protein